MRRSRSARQYANDLLKHTNRDGSAYRDDRLDTERQRLERRLAWAFQRGDVAGVKRLEHRLDQLADEALSDITPGRIAGPIERPRWH